MFVVFLARIVVVALCCGYCWLTTAIVTCDNIRRWGNLRHLCHNLVQPKDQHALRLEVFVFFVKCHVLQILKKIVFSDSASLQLAHKLLLQSGTNHHLNSKVPIASIVDQADDSNNTNDNDNSM